MTFGRSYQERVQAIAPALDQRDTSAFYAGPSARAPSDPPREDETYRGLFVPGRMTDGQRFRAAIDQAAELGYDTREVYVDASQVERYAPLKVAVGFAVRAWHEPVREYGFIFRETREPARVERPEDV